MNQNDGISTSGGDRSSDGVNLCSLVSHFTEIDLQDNLMSDWREVGRVYVCVCV